MYLYLKQKVFSIRDKLTFFDENQLPVYYVKGSLFKIPHRLTMSDAEGGESIQVRSKVFALLKTYYITDLRSGEKIGRVRRRFSLKQHFNIQINGRPLFIRGSLFGYQFQLQNESGENVLSVQKKYISWGDTYQVYIDETKINPEIACAVCIAFDNAVHNNKKH